MLNTILTTLFVHLRTTHTPTILPIIPIIPTIHF